jgi:hypothetical protein
MKSAFQGEMSIEPASGAILRITRQAVDLPTEFPVRQMRTAVEYMPVALGGISILLPARSLSFMDVLPPLRHTHSSSAIDQMAPAPDGREHYLNLLEFRNYHKFEAESNLAFEAEPDTPAAPIAGAPVAPTATTPTPLPVAEATTVTLPVAPPISAPPIVQARNGYLAPDRKLTEAEQTAREIEDAIFSRDAVREIPIAVRAEPAGKPVTLSAGLSATIHIGLGAIRFEQNDGHSRTSLIATVGLFDANGNYADGKQEKLDLDYADGNVPAGIDVRSDFSVPPGAYLVRVVIRDGDGHISSANQPVTLR